MAIKFNARVLTYFALLCLVNVSFAALEGHCPPLGPVLPAPTAPGSHEAVQSAAVDLKSIIDNITASFNGSALAVGVKSTHESEALFDYAYTPPNVDPRGVQKVDSNTVFRLASLSKVFPVLVLLKLHGVSLDDSITDYLPELYELNEQARAQNAIWTVKWDDITLGALASHLGGIAADLFTDVQPYGDWTQLGFPPDDVSQNLNCSGLFGLPTCGEDVFDKTFGKRPPIYLPFADTPMYSNMGWALLGKVIEIVSNQSSSDFIQDHIWGPTGMEHTFADTPADNIGFIPTNDVNWNASIGFEGPAGNYYSTINDLLAFGDAVLKNELLSPAKTRKWLKPVALTSSGGTMIGQPWEIVRTQNLTKDGRLVDVYTKAGDLITYHSTLALIPDYDLVLAVLVGGPEVNGGVVQDVFSKIITALIPAVEAAGKDESKINYAGTYSDTASNSSITLALDDAPGFSITDWTVRGVNIIDTYLSTNLPPVFPTPPGLVRFRLYPTNIKTDHQSSWRAMPAVGTAEEIEKAESEYPWQGALCATWASLDRIAYQLLSSDHFVFTEDTDRRAIQLELVGSQSLSLVALPIEIQTRIILYLVHTSIESVRAVLYTCKQLYDIALPLSVHTFRNPTENWDDPLDGPSRELQFLRYITIVKPHLARHVKSLVLGTFLVKHHDDGPVTSSHDNFAPGDIDKYTALIEKTTNQGDSKESEKWRHEWLKDLHYGNGDAEISVLLVACPNLEQLIIGEPTQERNFTQVIKTAAKLVSSQPDESSAAENDVPLRYLREFYCESQESKYGYLMWSQYADIVRLPHLYSFECIMANGGLDSAKDFSDIPRRSSSVEEIILRKSCITADVLCAITGACKALRSFEYTRGVYHMYDEEMMPRDLLEAILPFSDTLEYLHVNFEDDWESNGWTDHYDKLYMGVELRQMKKLKKLVLGMQSLTGMLDGPQSDVFTEPLPLEVEGAPTLVENVPKNLEHLEIHGCGKAILSQAQELLDLVSKGDEFPNLERIRFLFNAENIERDDIRLTCDSSTHPVQLEIVLQSKQNRHYDLIHGFPRASPYIANCCTRIYSKGTRERWLRLRCSDQARATVNEGIQYEPLSEHEEAIPILEAKS
ncbi:hypothetical protein G7046_g1473 [Stylonectria norvegica]|nr:hypothetical protein G7046_g1473 [Stylonectria norvegica]